jgi:hypothetical protein
MVGPTSFTMLAGEAVAELEHALLACTITAT